jgi:predicted transcriptional regulator
MHSYVRRGFAAPKETSELFFYVTRPIGRFGGYAEFVERRTGDAEELWNTCGHESVLASKGEYDVFVGDRRKVSFIRFDNLREASRTVVLNDVFSLLGATMVAKGGFYIDKGASDKLVAMME